ncbi:hypothetical protein [Streptomyces sp. ISL-94]|uniref:hypothetical protein n=1 Tax=Streptomyces sp. ISL-94 TaxID=2819190 RepID=UPI001BE5CADE|nr:hypothetical protein [Streptomyces sp. ISL-94]MBT2478392.1 hypothetical protein [Streptomyces sp. ISL-94]
MRPIPVHTAASKAVTPCCISIDTDDTSSLGVVAVVEPSSDLLDRAQVGWERFLDTFEGAPDE